MIWMGVFVTGILFVLLTRSSVYAQDVVISENINMRFNGNIGVEGWYFPRKAPVGLSDHRKSVNGQLDLTFQFKPPVEFRLNQRFKIDFDNSDLNRYEIEDMYLDYFNLNFEARAGFQIFSWKTVESVSQADFLNQTDLENDLLDADKLSELALRLRFVPNTAVEQVFEFYYLPRMRATRLPIGENRFSFGLPVSNDADDHLYQSDMNEWRPQFALSYERFFFGQVGARFFYFNGYNRFPGFAFDGRNFMQEYRLVHKGGLAFQGELDAWLLKGEMVYTSYQKDLLNQLGQSIRPKYFAYTLGFEYTFYSAIVRNHDVGAIVELIGDTDTGKAAAELEGFRPFRNHLFAGFRYAFNNISDRSFLFGGFVDYREGDMILSFEYEDRISDVFTVNFIYTDLIVDTSPLDTFSHADRLLLEVNYNF